jgi:hypothetical protein
MKEGFFSAKKAFPMIGHFMSQAEQHQVSNLVLMIHLTLGVAQPGITVSNLESV